MYQSVEYLTKRHNEQLEQARRLGQVARLRALRRATRRAERAADRLNRARERTRQLRSELDVMS